MDSHAIRLGRRASLILLSVSHLFDKAGTFTVKATLTVNVGESEKTFSDELSFTVQHPAWKSSLAHVVPEEFLSSGTYLYGEDGGVPSSTVLYGRGESMRFGVTTLEDVEYDSVSWYVNGTIAPSRARARRSSSSRKACPARTTK